MATGPGWLRYNGDGYGDCQVGAGTTCAVTGAPWTNNLSGTGHPWPVLGVERAQQYLVQGQAATAGTLLSAINTMNSGPGLVQRTGLGLPERAAVALRLRPGHRIDRLHQRKGRRLGLPADLGIGVTGPADG